MSDGTVPAERARRRILLADGSETYRAVAARVLADAGYVVDAVGDGAEALARLGRPGAPPDLVVLDLDLPRVRGLDLLRRLRAEPRGRETPALVVSESLSPHLRGVLADLGGVATLSKNHALRELLWHADALVFPGPAERRRGPRRLRCFPVNFWAGERLLLETCFDLSEVGMFIACADEEPLPVGTRIRLRFWLPHGESLVACEAEVVWVNAAAGDLRTTHPPGMGVRFLDLDAVSAALVRSWVEASA